MNREEIIAELESLARRSDDAARVSETGVAMFEEEYCAGLSFGSSDEETEKRWIAEAKFGLDAKARYKRTMLIRLSHTGAKC